MKLYGNDLLKYGEKKERKMSWAKILNQFKKINI